MHDINETSALSPAQSVLSPPQGRLLHRFQRRGERRGFGDDMTNEFLKGWKTPNTYDSSIFETLPDSPGIYIFVEITSNKASTVFDYNPIYVGMSRNIRKRCNRHPVLRFIRAAGIGYVAIYFCELSEGLRDAETELIKELRPRYNIQGKQ